MNMFMCFRSLRCHITIFLLTNIYIVFLSLKRYMYVTLDVVLISAREIERAAGHKENLHL